MKRMLMTAVASSLLALAAPSMASAHHSKGHHGGHHALGHSRHAARARLVTFTATSAPGSTSGTSTTPPAPGEPAGTVTSFENGVLTITLADKKTVVSGKVTDQTELRCEPPASSTGTGDDEGGGDDQSGSDGAGNGDSSMSAHAANHQQDSQDGGEGGNQDEAEESCTTALLVPGAMVREAELRLTSTGAEWEKVVLVH
jgi:hypothetical protein